MHPAKARVWLLVISTSFASALVHERGYAPKCYENRCIAAVSCSASKPAVKSAHRADCSSFQRHTVVPSPATTTTTITQPTTATTTVTPTVTVTSQATSTLPQSTSTYVEQDGGMPNKRGATGAAPGATVCPSHIPPYASRACSNAAQYASACACWGIGPTTVTAPRSTVTSTVTVPGTAQTTAIVTAATVTVTTTETTTVDAPVATATETVACDANNMASYTDSSGDSYDVYCRRQESLGQTTVLRGIQDTGFQKCLDACGENAECQSANYNVAGFSGSGYHCILYSLSSTGSIASEGDLYAIKL